MSRRIGINNVAVGQDNLEIDDSIAREAVLGCILGDAAAEKESANTYSSFSSARYEDPVFF
ncbi:hypothetical protein ACHAP5_005798 [Fusarium lateritium]